MDYYSFSTEGKALGPTLVTSTDAAQALPTAIFTLIDQPAIAVTITCETNPIRYGFGVTPTQAGLGHILYPGSALRIANSKAIRDFRFISMTAQTAGVIQVTGEYEI
jgi:hypothetical protein